MTKELIDYLEGGSNVKVKIRTVRGQYFKTIMKLCGKGKTPLLWRPGGKFTPITPLEDVVGWRDPVTNKWLPERD